MTRSCLFQALLCFSVLFLDCFSAENVLNSAKAGSFCIWTRSTSDGRTHYTFLQRTLETSQTSLVLYDSLWSGNNSLVSCITSNERSVIESYLSKCHSSSVSSFSETSDVPFNISELVEPGGPCRNAAITEGFTGSVRRARDLRGVDPDGSVDQDSRESSRLKLHRSKRAWMIPGTVWCGSGNKATNFTDLGVFEETDKCCREHDHCKDTIASFTFNHGMFNTNIFTLSHCDCDNRFRRCLLGVNDTMSNIVGYGYFNVLKMRCFEFSHRMQCAKRTWWGMCAFFEPTRFAVVKGPTNYTDTLWETDNNTLAISFHHTISAGENQATTSKASLIIQAKDSTGTGAELTTVTAPPGPSVTTLVARKTEPNVVPTDPPKTTPTQAKRDRQRKGKSEICGSYRDLDSCHLQIPALQEKFGLRNPDFRTLYHCNCTARLAQQISRPDDVDPVHSLLMDFVSQSCFTLTQSENCTEGSSCFTPPNAALMKRWTKDTTEERHLVDIKRRFKRINSKRSKRKDSPVKLYKKCLRMHTKLHRTPVHEQTLS